MWKSNQIKNSYLLNSENKSYTFFINSSKKISTKKIIPILSVIILILSVFLPVRAEENQNNQNEKFEKAKQKDIDWIKRKREKLSEISGKSKLQRKAKTKEEKDKKNELIHLMGQTQDKTHINSLLEILKDENEDDSSRLTAANSLFLISSTRWFRDNELEAQIQNEIIPILKNIYQKNNEDINKRLSDILYRLGEKDLTEPMILKKLKGGDEFAFNIFYYEKKIGEILVEGTYIGSDETKKVDKQAEKILKEALGKEYPERIRIESAHILIKKFGEKEVSFNTLVDIINNSKEKGYRILALSELKYIGDERSKKIILDSQNDHEIGETAKDILMFQWGKK